MGRSKKLLILLCALSVPILLYCGLRWLENRNTRMYMHEDYTRIYEQEPVIEFEGKRYRRRSDITSILLMGIDRESDTEGGHLNGGHADFLRLLIIDSKNCTVSQLQIDRDTMTPITIISVTGEPSGMRNAQISLSHGFGKDSAHSAELTLEAVSNLLLGEEIDFYISMNMDGIPALNDWTGGVEVTLEDDFSMLDPAMTQGTTLTLVGQQAEYYVRSRMIIGQGTNVERMKRQQEYISRLIAQTDERIGSRQEEIQSLLDTMTGYIVTDMPYGRIVNEFWAARDYERLPIIEPEGVHKVSENGFMEFEIDEKSMESIVVDLFYEKTD